MTHAYEAEEDARSRSPAAQEDFLMKPAGEIVSTVNKVNSQKPVVQYFATVQVLDTL